MDAVGTETTRPRGRCCGRSVSTRAHLAPRSVPPGLSVWVTQANAPACGRNHPQARWPSQKRRRDCVGHSSVSAFLPLHEGCDPSRWLPVLAAWFPSTRQQCPRCGGTTLSCSCVDLAVRIWVVSSFSSREHGSCGHSGARLCQVDLLCLRCVPRT